MRIGATQLSSIPEQCDKAHGSTAQRMLRIWMKTPTKDESQSEERAKCLGDSMEHHDYAPRDDIASQVLPKRQTLSDIHGWEYPYYKACEIAAS